MSAVLVTGGAGYIGGHAARTLAASGRPLVIYDDLSAGHEAVVTRIRGAFPHASVTFVRGDVRDRAHLAGTMGAHDISAVMHFASQISVGESVANPAKYYDANVGGAAAVLGAMADAGVTRFVFSSTAATFGEPVHVPIDESHPQRPINAYGETKLAIERALPHFGHAHGLRWVTLRYFNAAGADPGGLLGEDHEPEIHLLPRAILAAQGAEPLVIYGDDYPTPDGTCVRDFVHVNDLADAHLLALVHLERGGAPAAYNLGNGEGISVREIVRSIERVSGRTVPVEIGPRRDGDPSTLVASSVRAKAELGWRPQLGHVDAIVETAWRWHERHPRGYRT